MKVMIATPTAGIVHADYTTSLTKMILFFMQTPILGNKKEHREIMFTMAVGASIGQNRDNMVEDALKNDCTHVLFLDDDMGWDHDCLNIAAMRRVPIVIGNYRRKVYPGLFTARNHDNSASIKTTEESTSLEKCSFGGFGFALIERQVFEAVPLPRFLHTYDPATKTYSTEDLPFYTAASKAGFQAWVDHDLSKKLRHNGNFQYTWDTQFDY
jgi:hypothetical protein